MSPARLAIFVSIFTTITFSVHYYIWARLVRDTAIAPPWNTVLTWAIILLAISIPLGLIARRFTETAMPTPFVWVTYIWMGAIFFLLVLAGATDLMRVGQRIIRVATSTPFDPDRRVAIARIYGVIIAVGGGVLVGASMFEGLRSTRIKRVLVKLAKLPVEASGYSIVQMSDIHVGPTIGKDFIMSLVEKSNALDPDLVVITGDLVDGSVEDLGAAVEPLKNLRAKDGVFFVTGNHEYYSGADEWIAFLTSLGIKVLRNERVPTRAFDLAGVDDWTAHQFGNGHGANLPRALEGRDPERAVVLLAHQPKAIAEAEKLGVDLQLSGHTHGGQLFPFNFLVKLQQPFVNGLHAIGATQIYVSNGTGYWGPPMRLGAPAEITRIELQRTS
jgi:predicted MPP superfamily phosphohydrolase